MATEINVYYIEHNIVFSLDLTFAEFFKSSFHFIVLLNPFGHTVYKIMYKLSQYDATSLIISSIFF